MAILSTGNTFGATDTVTSTKPNNIANAATFDDPVDDSTLELHTDGKLRIKANGVGTTQIATSSVTKAKIENVASMKVLGNTSGSATAPQEVDVLDEDDMTSSSATALATQQSIKAYSDTTAQSVAMKYSGATGTISVSNSYADLDLSSVVGSNRAMVMIEFIGTGTAASTFFRTKGSSVDAYSAGSNSGWGSTGLVLGTGYGGTISIITDANGVIQHRAPSVSSTANYTVQAYQVLQ